MPNNILNSDWITVSMQETDFTVAPTNICGGPTVVPFLDDIGDVQATNPANGSVIVYDSATHTWKATVLNLVKSSNIPGWVPAVSELQYGELALNYADGKLYYRTVSDTISSLDAKVDVSVVDALNQIISNQTGIKTIAFDQESGFSAVDLGDNVVKISLNNLNPLVFTGDAAYRTLTSYIENGTSFPVRKAEFIGDKLRLTLASFTPIISVNSISTAVLKWDEAAVGFSVNVQNPTDYPDQWISSVAYLNAVEGTASEINTFTANAQTAIPGGGVTWSQTFSVNDNSYIRPSSISGLSGGNAQCNVGFNYNTVSNSEILYSNVVPFNIVWENAISSITIGSLSGKTFLESYTQVPYTVSVQGIANPLNYSHTIAPTNGNVSNAFGNGIFSFNDPIHKNNQNTYSLQLTTTFTRPASVTGTIYTANNVTSDSDFSAIFTYPSFWLFTSGISIVPTREDIVINNGFETNVTTLGDRSKIFAGYVNNNTDVPRAFWLGVVSSASQPTVFRTGISPSLLNLVTIETGNIVNLEPDNPPAGYVSVQYTLYGIILQPGITYVSIA